MLSQQVGNVMNPRLDPDFESWECSKIKNLEKDISWHISEKYYNNASYYSKKNRSEKLLLNIVFWKNPFSI